MTTSKIEGTVSVIKMKEKCVVSEEWTHTTVGELT